MKKNKLILVILLLLFSAAIAYESIIYVSPIKGRVVDAETGKPMKGVNVRAGWVTGYADPGGGSFRTFKVYATKTDENGKFVLSWTIKLKIPVIERYTGINVLIYEHGYSALYKDTTGNTSYLATGQYIQKIYGHVIDVRLPRLKSDVEYLKNIEGLNLWLSIRTLGEDIPFIIKEYETFLQKFPFVKDAYIYHQSLGYLYETYEKNYEAAINEYKQSILINKDSSFAGELQEKISKMQNMLKEKGREDSK